MTKWEYKILTEHGSPIYNFTMNELGEDGWELVSVVAIQVDSPHTTGTVRMYFKRALNG